MAQSTYTTLSARTSAPGFKKFEGDENYPESGDGREARVLEYLYAHPTLPEMRGSPSKILAVMDEFAAREDFLISVGPEKERLLTGIIAAEAPKVLVELGGYIGYSAVLFADAMQHASPVGAPSPVVRSLEFSQEFADVAAKVIALAGLSHIVKIVVGPAGYSLHRVQKEGNLHNGIDVLFLAHVEDLYEQDLKVCEELREGYFSKFCSLAMVVFLLLARRSYGSDSA